MRSHKIIKRSRYYHREAYDSLLCFLYHLVHKEKEFIYINRNMEYSDKIKENATKLSNKSGKFLSTR